MAGEAAAALPYFPAPTIIEVVAGVFGISVDKLREVPKARKGEPLANAARYAAALLMREFTPLAKAEIARALGRKDGRSGLELLAAAEKLIESDPRFGPTLELARQRLVGGSHV